MIRSSFLLLALLLLLTSCVLGPIDLSQYEVQLPWVATQTIAPTATLTPIPTPTATPLPVVSVRVMTYNIFYGAGVNPGHLERGGNNYRYDDLVTLVRQANPDILGMQEILDWPDALVQQFADALGMQVFLAEMNQGFYLGLFSKYPILEAENLYQPLTDGRSGGALRALVQLPDGTELAVAVVHFDPGRSAVNTRSCQFGRMRAMLEVYADKPAVLMGDLNTFVGGVESSYLTSGGWQLVQSDWLDAILVHSPWAWSAQEICVSSDAARSDCVTDTGISDHRPVGTVLSLYSFRDPNPPTPEPVPAPLEGCR